MTDESTTDEFASMFDNLSAKETEATADTAPVVETPAAAAAETPAAETSAETPAVEGGEGAEDEGLVDTREGGQSADAAASSAAASEAQVSAPTDRSPAQAEADDILARLARVIKSSPEPVKPAPQQRQQQEPPIFTAEQIAALQKYRADFPDIAQMEQMIRQAEYRQMTQYIFAEVAKALGPMVQNQNTVAEQMQLDALYARIPDYDTIYAPVQEWIKKQPPYLRAAYEHVVAEGTADDVVDLVARYRVETGTAAPGGGGGGGSKPAQVPAATQEIRQAAKALTPVKSKRSGAIVEPSKDDYDGSFDRAAQEMV